MAESAESPEGEENIDEKFIESVAKDNNIFETFLSMHGLGDIPDDIEDFAKLEAEGNLKGLMEELGFDDSDSESQFIKNILEDKSNSSIAKGESNITSNGKETNSGNIHMESDSDGAHELLYWPEESLENGASKSFEMDNEDDLERSSPCHSISPDNLADDLLVMNKTDFSDNDKKLLCLGDSMDKPLTKDDATNEEDSAPSGDSVVDETSVNQDDQESAIEQPEEEESLDFLVQQLCHLVSSNNTSAIEDFLKKHEEMIHDLCLTSHTNGETAVTLAGTLGLVKVLTLFSDLGVWLHIPDSEGYLAIHRAAHNGHTKVVEYLAELGQWNSKTKCGFTPLHIASTVGNLQMTKNLLSHVVEIDEACDMGWTTLHMASQGGHEKIVQILLEHGANIDTPNAYGETALYIAAQDGCLNVVEELISFGANVNATNKNGASCLYIATQLQKLDIVTKLLEAGAEPNLQDNLGWAPLHKAAHSANINIIRVLLEKGAEANVENKKGISPLMLVCSDTSTRAMKVLIEFGANINSVGANGYSILHSAVQTNQIMTMDLLITSGADINVVNNKGITPLHIASLKGYADSVALLLSHNANVNIASNTGVTPLHMACQFEHEKVVSILLGNLADATMLTNNGETAFTFASFLKNTKIVQLLLEVCPITATLIYNFAVYGRKKILEFLDQFPEVQFEVENHAGWTALHIAAVEGGQQAARAIHLLANEYIDPDAMDHDGNTPLHVATQKGHTYLMSTLFSVGVAVDIPNTKGERCLNIAIQEGNMENVVALVGQGASLSYVNDLGETCIFDAVSKNHTVLTEYLVSAGADINHARNDSLQLVHLAASFGNSEILSFLLAGGANLAAKDNIGNTPLHFAAEKGHPDVVDILAEAVGSRGINFENILGKKALHLAAGNSHSTIVETLLLYGTKLSLLDEDGKPIYELAKKLEIWNLIKEWTTNNPSTLQPPTSGTSSDDTSSSRVSEGSRRVISSRVVYGPTQLRDLLDISQGSNARQRPNRSVPDQTESERLNVLMGILETEGSDSRQRPSRSVSGTLATGGSDSRPRPNISVSHTVETTGSNTTTRQRHNRSASGQSESERLNVLMGILDTANPRRRSSTQN